jgi:hypothetical protein
MEHFTIGRAFFTDYARAFVQLALTIDCGGDVVAEFKCLCSGYAHMKENSLGTLMRLLPMEQASTLARELLREIVNQIDRNKAGTRKFLRAVGRRGTEGYGRRVVLAIIEKQAASRRG